MPFTPAHAAAAWPIHRIAPRLPLSALVIGTMSPDFLYWLHLAPRSRWAHSLPGIFLFCVPVSLAVWHVFRRFIRPALLQLLPPGMAARVPPPVASLHLAAAAVLIGALTHVAWDGFTHPSDWGVTYVPALRADAVPRLLPGLKWFKVLQHASSIAGLSLVAIWVLRWVRRYPPEMRRFATGQAARTIRILAMMMLAALCGGAMNVLRAQPRGFAQAMGLLAIGGMIGLSIALLTLALRHRARESWR